MVNDLTDKEQIDVLKKWWRDYGKSITLAVVLGLSIGFGWRGWHQHQTRQLEQASMMYAQLQMAYSQNQVDSVKLLTTRLIQDYAKTPYASLAALFTARDDVAQKKYTDALYQFQWVIQHARLNSLKQIARLRAARILLMQQQPQAALQMLQTVNDANYQALIHHVKGDIYTSMGHAATAKQAYQTAAQELRGVGVEDPILSMKVSQ